MVRSVALPLFTLALAATGCARRAPLPPPAPLFPAATAWTVAFAEAALSLATDGTRLLVGTADGGVHALEPDTGASLWSTPRKIGVLSARAGLAVLREADGTVWSLDPETGDSRWKVDSGVPGSLPALLEAERMVVAGQGLAALDPRTGGERWKQPAPPVLSASLAEGALLLGEEGGVLRRRDAATGATLWQTRPGGTAFAPALIDDRGRILLGTDGRAFLALDLADGSRDWRWRLGASVQSAPAALGDRVLFASLEGVLYALKRSSGNLVWRAELPSRPLTGPILLGTAVLVACHGVHPEESVIVGVDGRTGTRLGTLLTPAEIRPPVIASSGRLFVALRDRRVVAIALRGVS